MRLRFGVLLTPFKCALLDIVKSAGDVGIRLEAVIERHRDRRPVSSPTIKARPGDQRVPAETAFDRVRPAAMVPVENMRPAMPIAGRAMRNETAAAVAHGIRASGNRDMANCLWNDTMSVRERADRLRNDELRGWRCGCGAEASGKNSTGPGPPGDR
jgi:hypothetical protein